MIGVTSHVLRNFLQFINENKAWIVWDTINMPRVIHTRSDASDRTQSTFGRYCGVLSTCPKKCSASKTGGKKDLMKKFHFSPNMVSKMSMQDFS